MRDGGEREIAANATISQAEIGSPAARLA